MRASSIRLVFDFPATPDGPPHRRVLRAPREVVVARRLGDVSPALDRVEAAVADGALAGGFLSYEAAPAFDPAMAVRPGCRTPLVWFAIFDGASPNTLPATTPTSYRGLCGDWSWDLSREEFDAAVATVKEVIEAGGSYQVNLTTRLTHALDSRLDPVALYEALRAAQGRGYHALLETGDFTVVSASPELFFHREHDVLTTRPMKGTRPRGRWLGEDEARRRELIGSDKELAENRMIVDLLRNDVGRIAETGSVTVPRLLEVERYRTVLQMTSTVEGRVGPDRTLRDVLGALFPCGSVTGAPKVAAMRVIASLERSPREVYCGAVGILDGRTGTATFNVPIRTLWIDRGARTLTYGTGAGITWDSTAGEEYREMEAKAQILVRRWPSFQLVETLRLDQGLLSRVDRHILRLRDSAAYFGRPFPESRIRDALREVARGRPGGTWRVRLTLSESGAVDVDVGALDPSPPPSPPPVALSTVPVDESDPFLFHKTTHRETYVAARARHPEAFDVLLWNGDRHVTEFTRGNVVAEIDGALTTPPVCDGLLAGCLRAELVADGRLRVRSLSAQEIAGAERIYFVNSLRGWIEVRLGTGGDA